MVFNLLSYLFTDQVIKSFSCFYAVFRIRRPPGSGSVLICTDLDPDPSINKQKLRKSLISAVSQVAF
jgi:hypothetical protein